MASPKTVVIGFLGSQLDAGQGAGRWEKWRPTLSIVQHEDMAVQRFELLYSPQHRSLAELVAADVHTVSPETTVNLVEMPLKDPWDFGEVYAALYDWVRAYRFDTERERYWVHITTGTHVAQICMYLLAEARFIPGPLLQTSPPRKQKAGNPGSYALIDLDLSKYDQIAQRFERAHADAVSFLKAGIATQSPRFNALIDEVERVAVRSKAPVLLIGPTGAGKSHLARRMYELKKARHQLAGPFVEVNCATLRGDGAASALFGHKKGAYTGAQAERAGYLRSAHQGLLFLDEIGELGLDEQAMLLKAIEEKRFYPLGSDAEVESDFQLVAGTHRDLRAEVAAGRFRDDLFARINLWTYALPGLAERSEDIAPNIEHLLQLHARETGQVARFNVEARERYLRFARSAEACWRGNFRDLSASITRLATLAEGGRIGLELVEAEIERLRWLWRRQNEATQGRAEALLGPEAWAALDHFDQLQLDAVLAVCAKAPSLSEAGRQLFNVSRTQRSVVNDADRLRKYLGRYGLSWERVAGR
ncbi:RNA repair transcriptional activator RtcR [Inhella proteolytica]|uniref:Sigma 54-interacting transcriptional regulator n=1 Tax=Inhella proteolytica TaxID=2795029 RepID=A0A931J5Q6_9BURK|nr:RNA repair transcriptional activator RtcR [Inhella proteolytica]MBH9576675.1 sigma 54-interacting transcriptional regulator [Inhella proteolytica]